MDELELLQIEIERWLNKQGFDVDLGLMSEDEIAEFFGSLSEQTTNDLGEYIDAVAKVQTFERADGPGGVRGFILGDESVGTVALDAAMLIPAFRAGRIGRAVASGLMRVLPMGRSAGWLTRLLGRTAAESVKAATPAVRAGGMGRVEDAVRIWGQTASGVRPGSLAGIAGRTTAGSGARLGVPAAGLTVSPEALGLATAITGVVGIGQATNWYMERVGDRLYPSIDGKPVMHPDTGEMLTQEEANKMLQAEATADGNQPTVREALGLPTEDVDPIEAGTVATMGADGSIPSFTGDDAAGILKQIYFQGLSETAGWDKMTNYIAGSGVLMLAATGGSLGQAIRDQSDLLGETEVVNLRSDDGKEYVTNYLLAHWQDIPEIAQRVVTSGNLSVGAAGGSAVGIVRGQVTGIEDAIATFVDELAERAPTMLVAAETPNKPGEMIGIITSYDGTEFGEIVSLNDLTSGGKIGDLNALPLLEASSPEQIAMWQQQLYAWGFLERPPTVWGQLTVDPVTGALPTLAAFHNWQISVANEGFAMVRASSLKGENKSLSELITNDGTPRADRVINSVIANKMSGESTRATQARELRQNVLDEAKIRVNLFLSSTGRYMPQGAQLQLESGLNEVINGMSPKRREQAFGQGGSVYERTLAENVLREFYGTDDWGAMLTFGNQDRDASFFDYSSRVGAVSNRERELLRAGAVNRDRYRFHWDGREHELKEAEKDVAVSSLLKFISEGMGQGGDFSNVSASNIADGLISYAHTIGQRQALNNPQSYQQMVEKAWNALESSRASQFERDDELLSDVAMRGVEQLGLEGGTSGYQYRSLVKALNRIGGQAGHLRSRNV
jgi:hypothetical protein